MDELTDDELQPVEQDVISLDRLSRAAADALGMARGFALDGGDAYVGTEHLLIALAECKTGAAWTVLDALSYSRERIEREILFISGPRPARENGGVDPVESPRLQAVMVEAAKDAARRQSSAIGTLNILSALMRVKEGVAVLLLESPGVKLERVGLAVSRAHREGAKDAE